MFDTNMWLLVAAIATLCVQGIQLGQIRLNWLLPMNGVLVVSLLVLSSCFFMSDFMANQHLLEWQSFAKEQLQTIQIIVLLELALAIFLRCKLLPVSSVLALFYGQLLFFQQGWLNLPFHWQGLLYGIVIMALFIMNLTLIKIEALWDKLVFIVLLVCTFLTSSKLPKTSPISNNWQEMFVSLASLLFIVIVGIAFSKFKTIRNNL